MLEREPRTFDFVRVIVKPKPPTRDITKQSKTKDDIEKM